MNDQPSESEIAAMKRILLVALASYFLLVIVVFCITLSHPPANPCPAPMSMLWH